MPIRLLFLLLTTLLLLPLARRSSSTLLRPRLKLHGGVLHFPIRIRHTLQLTSIQTPSNTIEFQIQSIGLQLCTVANEMENVDAVLRIHAGADVAETPGPDEFVAADYYVFGLDGLDWGGVWGDEEGGVSFSLLFFFYFFLWLRGGGVKNLRVMPWR